jgi:carbon monoxide dehydrogenase subunit G
MELSESRQIAAPPDVVWSHLVDPEVLKACIPGCQELTGTPEEGYDATVVQKVGPVKATFKGHVTMSDVRPGEGCHLAGEGKGGAAGFAKGGADITLAPEAGGTLLTYDAKAKVGGKIAQLGGRVVDGFARKMANEFFDRFKAEVEGPDAAPAAAAAAAVAADPAPEMATAAAAPAAPPPGPAPEPAAAATAPPASAPSAAAPPSEEPKEKKGFFKRIFG